jgi:hypothetical protein
MICVRVRSSAPPPAPAEGGATPIELMPRLPIYGPAEPGGGKGFYPLRG